jgi:hypothetical protein
LGGRATGFDRSRDRRRRRYLWLLRIAPVPLGGHLAATVVRDIPAPLLGVIGAVGLGVAATRLLRTSIAVASLATWAIIGAYLAGQFGLGREAGLVAAGLAGVGGLVHALLDYRGTTMVLTTVQGAVMLVIGWVSVTSQLAPSLGVTFREWANSQELLVPGFLAMLFATAYSCQAMRRQRNIKGV